MASYTNGLAEWFDAGGNQTRAFTFTSTPTVGQTILLLLYRDNDLQLYGQAAASAAGYTSAHYSVAPTDYTGAFDLLYKTSDGTETGVTVDFGETLGWGHVLLAAFADDIDPAGAAVDFVSGAQGGDASSSGTFAGESLATTLHFLGMQGDDANAPVFPAGDTLITAEWNLGTFRGAGVYESGGGTAWTAPDPDNWVQATISFPAANPQITTTITTPTDGAEYTSGQQVNLEMAIVGPESYDAIGYRLQRSDTAQWWTGNAWQTAETAFEVTLGTPAPTPNSALFSNLPTVEDDVTFTATTRASGVTSGWGPYSTAVAFSGPIWEYAPDITFTVANAVTPPVCNDDTATTGQDVTVNIDVLTNDTGVDAAAVLTIETQPANGVATVVA